MTGPDEERPNFFLLLGLDPAVPWDEALFNREFAKQRASWTKASGGIGRRASEAKAKLFWKEQIDGVMRDPERREQEQARAGQLQEAARIARRAELSARLDLLLVRGFLLEEEVAKLRTDFAEVLESSPELKRRLAAAPLRQALSDVPAPLDPAREAEILTHLDGVRAQSLYDVLHEVDQAVTHTSAREVLLAAADQLADKAHKIKDKRNPKVLHWERLSSLARVVFGSDDEHRRHDVSMRQARLQSLLTDFEETLSIAAEVSAPQVELFLRRARDRGIEDIEHARGYFVEYFRARKWPVQLPAEETQRQLARLVQCAYCHELNKPREKVCQTCGESLRIPCPNCGQVEPRYGGGCRCGFPIGQRPLVESLLAEARSAAERLDLERARLDLERAERIWRLPPDRADELTVRLRDTRRALDETRDRITTAATSVERLIRERRFVAAVEQLRAAPDGLPQRDQLLSQAERAVDQAREHYRQARQPDHTSTTRAELYAEALRVCDDFEPARGELQRIPPEPPRRVRAVVDGPAAGVRLEWQPSLDPDISYVVVRGVGVRSPSCVEDLPDQQRVGTTVRTSWRDRRAAEVPGRTLRYAVFTERRGTFSAPAAAEPVLVAADAADVRCTAEEGRVVLTWRVPEHAVRVEVRRTALGSGADGVVLSELGVGRAVDTEVRTGMRYRYTLRVAYRDAADGLWWSPGVVLDVTPIERPLPPGPLTAAAKPTTTGMYRHRVQLRWPAAEAGVVWIVRQAGAGWLREGEVMAEDALHRDGLILRDGPPADDVWINSEMDLCSYFPVLLFEHSGHVGRPRRYAYTNEPADVEGEFGGATVRLGWRWPDGVVAALVGHDTARLPVDPTAASGQLVVDRLGGEPYGGVEVPAGDGGELYVLVAAVVRRDGLDFVTSGVPVRIRRPGVRVGYAVRHLNRRRRELILWTEQPVTLPALVLVSRPGRLPCARADGIRVAEIPSGMTVTGQRTVALPRGTGDESHHRLFTAAATDSVAVEWET
ncbi:hypothetical protein ABT023_09800 [Micromonospora sp. NPDC002296]|uniref:hypothetical protein n=1 Tax=Micromonospora sp. NPDC002296 TaxID=3154271 RepID=UPI003330B022